MNRPREPALLAFLFEAAGVAAERARADRLPTEASVYQPLATTSPSQIGGPAFRLFWDECSRIAVGFIAMVNSRSSLRSLASDTQWRVPGRVFARASRCQQFPLREVLS